VGRLYSNNWINKAGETLLVSPQNSDAFETLNYWRVLHTRLINDALPETVCNPAAVVTDNAYLDVAISSRIKRVSSIVNKLARFPNLKLSQMQDVAGFRYVVSNPYFLDSDIDWFLEFVEKQSNSLQDCFTIIKNTDYVSTPKDSGYRAVHFVLEHKDDDITYDGLRFELQLRTGLQHLWAMAVETVGMIYGQALKSSEGNADWLDYFKLVSAAFSLQEKSPVIPEHAGKSIDDIRDELQRKSDENHFAEKLQLIPAIYNGVRKSFDYYSLNLDLGHNEVEVIGFNSDKLENAVEYCKLREKLPEYSDGRKQIVLVSAAGFRNIEEAYPSYFLDLRKFNYAVNQFLIK
jgi:hypothetical protein